MPFRSEAQRRHLWATNPNLAREWTHKYGSKVVKKKAKRTTSAAKPKRK